MGDKETGQPWLHAIITCLLVAGQPKLQAIIILSVLSRWPEVLSLLDILKGISVTFS